MEQLFQNIDFYNIGSYLLSLVLAAIIPIMSYKYGKLLIVLKECKKLVKITLEACEDNKITAIELRCILKQLNEIMHIIKGE